MSDLEEAFQKWFDKNVRQSENRYWFCVDNHWFDLHATAYQLPWYPGKEIGLETKIEVCNYWMEVVR